MQSILLTQITAGQYTHSTLAHTQYRCYICPTTNSPLKNENTIKKEVMCVITQSSNRINKIHKIKILKTHKQPS